MHKIFDITVGLEESLTVWSGDPALEIERVGMIKAGDDANVSRILMSVLSGTHMDAPYDLKRISSVQLR